MQPTHPAQKIDYASLSPDVTKLLAEVEANSPQEKQLRLLQKLDTIMGQVLEGITQLSRETLEDTTKTVEALTTLKDALGSIDKEVTLPDYSKPITAALAKLDTSFAKAIKGIEVNPQVNVSAPNVDVSEVNLKGVEKVLKSDLPKAFQEAIKLIPKTEVPETDLSRVEESLSEALDWLKSIDTASRMKPLPGSMKVSNLSEVAPVPGLIPVAFDRLTFSSADANGNYQTGTVKRGGVVVGTLTLAYDASSNLTDIRFT